MLEPFDECRRSQHADPVDARTVEFDFDEVARALDGLPDASDDVARFADALNQLLNWMTEPVTLRGQCSKGADRLNFTGRRAVVIAWCLRPDRFEGRSLAKVADELGVQPERLHELSARFSRLFGVSNRSQFARRIKGGP